MPTIQERIDELEARKDAIILAMSTGEDAKRTRNRNKENENFDPEKRIAVLDRRIAELRLQLNPSLGTLAGSRRRGRLRR